MTASPLDAFSPAARAWFETSFPEPTPPQTQGWPAIARGEHTLILAPTGSGKTLSAFFWGLDRLSSEPFVPQPDTDPKARTRIIYISPLRALAVDVEKNLRAPLQGIQLAAERLGVPFYTPEIAVRTGDTSPADRRRMLRYPPDLLITTPESLYLMLTSQARDTLRNAQTIIIDEIHALAATKRGAHLSLSLERLDQLLGRPCQRIGLSATQRPLEEIAHFLGGSAPSEDPTAPSRPRPVTIIDTGVRKPLELEVVIPVDDLTAMGPPATVSPGLDPGPLSASIGRGETAEVAPVEGEPFDEVVSLPEAEPRYGTEHLPLSEVDPPPLYEAELPPVYDEEPTRSIWPSMHPRLLELIHAHRSTIVFVNARRLAERLATRLNELDAEQRNRGDEAEGQPPGPGRELVKAHHGSLSREQRLQIEDELKRGELKGLVATSSLELGIDMGAVDLVIQVASPGSVSRGLQRVGRAGHQVGAPSKGKIFPKHRSDLLEAAVVADRMRAGAIEATHFPRNPLDVLAQHIVAMVAIEDIPYDDIAQIIRGSANFAELSPNALDSVLDMLSGRYESDEFGDLRSRIVWDRIGGVISGRAGAQRLAVINAGTIPDRGLYGVFLPDGARVGELDEEMVYESRVGETFLLGASTWRIEDITHDRVVVTPAPGRPGKMPFWHGDGPGRPIELGRAIGEFVRELSALEPDAALARLREEGGLDHRAASNLVQFLGEQRDAAGAMPHDRLIIVERFRDEIGDWQICVLSPFGAQVHTPWAMAIQHRLQERWGMDVEMMWADDGIVIRLPEAIDTLPHEELLIDPDDIEELIVEQLPQTAMFAARFREASARALLLPKRRPDRRTPLWQQRRRAADLLAVASRYPRFPILLETVRECLHDVFDVPALREVLSDIAARRIRVHTIDTVTASPFAHSLLFGWIAQSMYEGDAPLAERRAAALRLDRELLGELLGTEELRELLDPEVLDEVEAERQRLVDGYKARDLDGIEELLGWLGPLSTEEIAARSDGLELGPGLERLAADRRIIAIHMAGDARWAQAADAARLRDGLGIAIPPGLPLAFTDPVPAPLTDLVLRYARSRAPFTESELATRFGISSGRAADALIALEHDGLVQRGGFRPGGTTREWCHPDVLRQIRRRSLARLRREVEPVDQEVFARFLPGWQLVGSNWSGVEALADVITVLQGVPLAISELESMILAPRLSGYSPADLDQLLSGGEMIWVGSGALGANDGRIVLAWRDQLSLAVAGARAEADAPQGPILDLIRRALHQRGAMFWSELMAEITAANHAVGFPDGSDVVARSGHISEREVLRGLWELVWAGEITNDSFAPLRAYASGAGPGSTRASKPTRARRGGHRRLNRMGPPSAVGRWTLLPPRDQIDNDAAMAVARAQQLLERYGVLSREMALAEGATGGFAGVYPVLKAMEERGQIRRGYFVSGLGAAQFALPHAVDQLRSERQDPAAPASDRGADPAIVLAATDPAQPYGAAIAWPETAARVSRSVGAKVVLADGQALAYLDKGGHHLVVFPAGQDDPRWVDALIHAGRGIPRFRLEITRINAAEPSEHPAIANALYAHGFKPGYRGPVFGR